MTTTESPVNRANIYRFLSHIFRRELSGSVAASLASSGVLELLEEDGFAVGSTDFANEARLKELSADYTRVFLGPGPHVSPYGSVHHPDDLKRGRLWGDTTVWVKRFIADHGVGLEGEKYDGIPDHVGHLLEFFSLLIEGEAKASEEGDAEKVARLTNSQRLLVEKQLGRWIPEFCRKVQSRASSGFYRGVAHLTAELVAVEQVRLGRANG